ncbi:NF-kappa-B inhibitor alpha-like [Dreissena polymorpha]|uniref:Uncharacterized protein n=1 Tax=Dreissena polymorpha TaxID=45954 RepID=A0A9D4EJ70_DREPO|nr:NF-kappa-B inhibitor alpha-like [Dreissena polymorpha]KAH3780268.1 hypothetical protein DPMN_158080 [Dreissena polymorpha]
MDIPSDLDSIVETDDCPTNVHVSSSVCTPQIISKVSDATSDEKEGHYSELLSAEIELSKGKEQRKQKDYFQETGYVTKRLNDVSLNDRLITHTTVEQGDFLIGSIGNYDIDVFINACTDADGDTPLHLAIICLYSKEQISRLINTVLNTFPDHDILNHQNDSYRQTPLHLAVLTKRTDTVHCLLDLGAQTTFQDNQLRTPAHIACGNGDIESLKALLETDENKLTRSIRLYDNKGQTCLHIAVLHSNLDIAHILLDHGADINAPDRKSGRTALHFAVEAGDISMITFLQGYPGIKIDARTFAGESPAQLAYERRATRPEVVEHLQHCRILEVSCGPSDDNYDGGDCDDDEDDVDEDNE